MKYNYISSQPGKVSFSPTTDVRAILSFGNARAKAFSASDRSKSIDILRTTMVYSAPKSVLAPGCTDQCNAIETALSVRVEISGPMNDVATVTAHLDETIRVLELNKANLLAGWLPRIDSTFEA
ncbi:MAG: hypothetical protein SaLV4_gp2 [Sanya levivirus 4]|uniref:Uncharacterized protein n=1 Tax=Sanya levivirus 4 TaxID=2905512 RepID=A0A8K1XZ45_9VIRU|nr:MAG: hypothetical protein SaLV4_gp2 [Sanya levivirus 4]